MKLYAKDTYQTKKVLMAAKLSGIEVELVKGCTEGRIPVLETEKGCIFSSNAIARYISRLRRDLGLYGQDLLASGTIDSWIDFCTNELEVPLGAWMQDKVPPAVVDRAKDDVKKALTVLDNHLLHYTYMVGDHITLADIGVCCVLHHGMKQVLTVDYLSSFGNLRRWFSLCTSMPDILQVLGKVEKGFGAPASAATPKKEEAPKKEAAPKKDDAKAAPAKKEAAPKKEAAAKKESKKEGGSKKEAEEKEPTAEELAEARKKQKKAAIKEGGKRGVEIEGAADMGGLQFFCTSVDAPDGDLDILEDCLTAMNAKSDPTEEERKGGSGAIGKMIFSAGTNQLAVAAYVPESKHSELSCEEWLKNTLALFSGEFVKADKSVAIGFVKADGNKNIFPLKIREPMILEANNFLRKKGLFPEDNGDDSDEMVFGDDDFPS